MNVLYDVRDITPREKEVISQAADIMQAFLLELKVDVCVQRVSDSLSLEIGKSLNIHESDIYRALQGLWDLRHSRRPPDPLSNGDMLVLCVNAHGKFAGMAQKANPDAIWGCALQGSGIAIVYNYDNMATFWHESFHLLGVADCYDENDPTHPHKETCSESNCVMRYGLVASELRLCSKGLNALLTTASNDG